MCWAPQGIWVLPHWSLFCCISCCVCSDTGTVLCLGWDAAPLHLQHKPLPMGVLGWYLTSSQHHLPQTTQCKTLLRFAQKSFCPFGKQCDFHRACARADQGFMMKGSLGKCKRGRLLFCLERKKPNHVQVLSSPVPQSYCISTKDWCLITFNVCCYMSHLSAAYIQGCGELPLKAGTFAPKSAFRKKNNQTKKTPKLSQGQNSWVAPVLI